MNINEIIFSKTVPQKKRDIINSLSEDELMSTTKATVLRIVKEVGSKTPHSRDKSLHVSYERKAGNDWNSIVGGLDCRKGRLYPARGGGNGEEKRGPGGHRSHTGGPPG